MSILGSLATWWFWAYYAAGFAIVTSVLAVHLRTTHTTRRRPWLVVWGGALWSLGAFIGGLQAGKYPPLSAGNGVAAIRVCWVSGITLGVVAAGLYLWDMKEKPE